MTLEQSTTLNKRAKKRFWGKVKKRLAKKILGNQAFNKFFKHGLPKPGDITADCDDVNHVITRIEGSIWDYNGIQCIYEEGGRESSVCDCTGQGYQPPYPLEHVINSLLKHDTPEGREWCKEWNFLYMLEDIDRIKRGEKVFDERGVRL